jgi:hypothetical protein
MAVLEVAAVAVFDCDCGEFAHGGCARVWGASGVCQYYGWMVETVPTGYRAWQYHRYVEEGDL